MRTDGRNDFEPLTLDALQFFEPCRVGAQKRRHVLIDGDATDDAHNDQPAENPDKPSLPTIAVGGLRVI